MTTPSTTETTPVDPTTPADPSTPAVVETTPPEDDSLDLPADLEAARKVRAANRNLRERSKTAEAERDALRAEVDGYRRQAVESIVAEQLRDVRDFTDRHPDLGAFIGQDGAVDRDAVVAAAQALATERPHMAPEPIVKAPPTQRPLESLRPGASPVAEPEPGPTWRGVLGRASGFGANGD